MTIFIYSEQKSDFLTYLIESIFKESFDSKVTLTWEKRNCLCESPLEKDVKLALVYPHRNNKKCFEKIKREVETNPQTQVYLLALGSFTVFPEIIIGEHKNLHYISSGERTEYQRLAQEIVNLETEPSKT